MTAQAINVTDEYADYLNRMDQDADMVMNDNQSGYHEPPANPFDDMPVAQEPESTSVEPKVQKFQVKKSFKKKSYVNKNQSKVNTGKKQFKKAYSNTKKKAQPVKTLPATAKYVGMEPYSPILHITDSRSLKREDAGQSVVRLTSRKVAGMKPRKGAFSRRSHVVVANKENGRKVVRFVYGGGSDEAYRDMSEGDIALDYDTRIELLLAEKEGNDVEIRSARWDEQIMFYLSGHHDHSVRWAMKFGLLGASLGAIGLIISLF